MDFSQRMGYLPASKVIQSESIDKDLRNTLWNILTTCYWDNFYGDYGTNGIANSNFREFTVRLYSNYHKLTLDSIPRYWGELIAELKQYILTGEWHRVYSLLEFIYQHAPEADNNRADFILMCNEAFKRENSAYRFVNGLLTPVTSNEEIAEIETAIQRSDAYSGVRTHLESSLSMLTNKLNPDYRNSIKESISAVESIAKHLTGNKSTTLGPALSELEKHHKLHPALKSAFSSLYGWTSNADGIRHSLMEQGNLTIADARFMLITCSAFINFAIDSTKD